MSPPAAALAPSVIGRAAATAHNSAGAHAAASYLTGIGDERTEMFQQIVVAPAAHEDRRDIAPYDAAVRPYSLDLARAWIKTAESTIEVLVAFYHSEYTPTKDAQHRHLQTRCAEIREALSACSAVSVLDEAIFLATSRALASPSAAAARYYQALIRVCRGPHAVVGLDVLDQHTSRRPSATSPNSSARSADYGPSCQGSGGCTTTRT